MGVRALVKGFKKNLPYIAENLPDLPQLAFKTLQKIANNELQIELQSKQLDSIRQEIRQANRRSIRAITGSGLVISAAIIAGLDGLAPMMIGRGQFILPLVSGVLLIPGIYLLFRSRD